MFYVFAASGRGSRRKFPFYPNGRGGGVKNCLREGGLYFGRTAYWNPPLFPLALPTYGGADVCLTMYVGTFSLRLCAPCQQGAGEGER